jgi:hypothetical protein
VELAVPSCGWEISTLTNCDIAPASGVDSQGKGTYGHIAVGSVLPKRKTTYCDITAADNIVRKCIITHGQVVAANGVCAQ